MVHGTFDMSEPLKVIKEIGMNLLCVEQPANLIIKWISTSKHTFPKTKKGWSNLINTQFRIYIPTPRDVRALFSHDLMHMYNCFTTGDPNNPILIHANTQLIIDWLVKNKVLWPSTYGRRLRANVHRSRALIQN